MKVRESNNLIDLENIKSELEAVNEALPKTFDWHSRHELLERVNKLLLAMNLIELGEA